MATKGQNIRDPQSCFNRAADDEPIFVLRAHDPLAADIVRRWAFSRELHKGFGDDAAVEARHVAKRMDDWRKVHE